MLLILLYMNGLPEITRYNVYEKGSWSTLGNLFSFLLTATKKGKAFVEIEEDHSEGEMDVEEAEEVIL